MSFRSICEATSAVSLSYRSLHTSPSASLSLPPPPPSPPIEIVAPLIPHTILICRAQYCLSGQIPLVISCKIHCLGHPPLSHHFLSVLTLSLAPLRAPLRWPRWAFVSGNQAGRAHFSAHIILPVITNEYELPAVGHTRREPGRGGRGGGCRSVTVLC